MPEFSGYHAVYKYFEIKIKLKFNLLNVNEVQFIVCTIKVWGLGNR